MKWGIDMKKLVILLLIAFLIFGCNQTQESNETQETNQSEETIVQETEEGETNMIMTINETDFEVTLEQNETVEALLDLLPLTFTMKDLNSNEKYYYLDQDLPSNSQAVSKIEAGDIMLFGDNCIVIFYKSFSTSYTYTRIGKFNDVDGLKRIVGSDQIDVTIQES